MTTTSSTIADDSEEKREREKRRKKINSGEACDLCEWKLNSILAAAYSMPPNDNGQLSESARARMHAPKSHRRRITF